MTTPQGSDTETGEGKTSRPALEALPEGLVEALAHGGPRTEGPSEVAPAPVEHIQTHLSHVFRIGPRVYKLHKAVDLGFVHFLRRADRNADAAREVLLNRRLAPEVYLGVAALRRDPAGGAPRLGPLLSDEADLEALVRDGEREDEHCVVMARLPDGGDALAMLQRGELSAEWIDRLANRIVDFHGTHRLGTPAPFSPEAWRDRIAGPMRANFESLEKAGPEILPPGLARETRALCEAGLARCAEALERRRREGRCVDGHGDLHLQHIWPRADGGLAIIDCIAFDPALRRIDPAAEVAFPAMDLAFRGRADLAERLLSRYAQACGDFGLYEVIEVYASYRAAVRAKVAALAAADGSIEAAQREAAASSARRHLEMARDLLRPVPPGPVVLVGGSVGTGKSSVASVLARRFGAVLLSSDRIRKQMHGLAPQERPDAALARRLYSEEGRAEVYGHLVAAARIVAASGRAALCDATFAEPETRSLAAGVAEELGVPCHAIEARCAADEALRRVRERARRDRDASDAGPGLVEESRRAQASWASWSAGLHLVADTDDPGWQERLEAASAEIRWPPSPLAPRAPGDPA